MTTRLLQVKAEAEEKSNVEYGKMQILNFHFSISGWSALGLSLLVALFLVPVPTRADTILASKHDLSVAGPGTIKALTESEVCIFCHTPHRAGQTPLWNHTLSAATYIPYSSSTTKATIGQPTGASKLCLSCHDGTVALGMVNTRAATIEMKSGISTLPAGRSNLGTDLSDDHPISFTYDSALTAANGQLKDPASLTAKVRLDHENQMQCTSCHDPHNNQYGKFLVQDNTASALCINCHSMNFWQNSDHRVSNKTWNGLGQNPWPHTDAVTVAANACENCHAPHSAGIRPRLLNFADEEMNCYSCHDGNVAAKNIQTEFTKPSVHPILITSGVHDPTENPINPPRHVECVDCHHPHAARTAPAVAPNASGALAGLTGVNADGAVVNPLVAQYELCFRCHADSIARGQARVPRQFVETNKRLQFRSENASFHPVEVVGKNLNVPSLVVPLTTSSRIYCTDCHNNDQGPGALGVGANGPHGSIYTPLLERELVLSDFNSENFSIYALCYKCHDRNSILRNDSFNARSSLGEERGHNFHIVTAQTACTTCHDSHGVQSQARLINFNTFYVTPLAPNAQPTFNSTGTFRGNCTLTCHGTTPGSTIDHNLTAYPQLNLQSPAKRPIRR